MEMGIDEEYAHQLAWKRGWDDVKTLSFAGIHDTLFYDSWGRAKKGEITLQDMLMEIKESDKIFRILNTVRGDMDEPSLLEDLGVINNRYFSYMAYLALALDNLLKR